MTKLNLEQILKITIPFVHKEEERYSINGIKLKVSSGKIKAVATNAEILITLDANFENVNNLEVGVYTIEYKSAKKLLALLKLNPNYQILKSDIVKLQDDFVDYKGVINPPVVHSESVRRVCVDPAYLKVMSEVSLKVLKIDKDIQSILTFGSETCPIRCNIDTVEFNILIIVAPIKIDIN